MKSTARWTEGYSGSNESGFNGLPGGYRVENGIFLNQGSIGDMVERYRREIGKAVTLSRTTGIAREKQQQPSERRISQMLKKQ
jgi:hypothetical protein